MLPAAATCAFTVHRELPSAGGAGSWGCEGERVPEQKRGASVYDLLPQPSRPPQVENAHMCDSGNPEVFLLTTFELYFFTQKYLRQHMQITQEPKLGKQREF